MQLTTRFFGTLVVASFLTVFALGMTLMAALRDEASGSAVHAALRPVGSPQALTWARLYAPDDPVVWTNTAPAPGVRPGVAAAAHPALSCGDGCAWSMLRAFHGDNASPTTLVLVGMVQGTGRVTLTVADEGDPVSVDAPTATPFTAQLVLNWMSPDWRELPVSVYVAALPGETLTLTNPEIDVGSVPMP